jgi:hypothetical protein
MSELRVETPLLVFRAIIFVGAPVWVRERMHTSTNDGFKFLLAAANFRTGLRTRTFIEDRVMHRVGADVKSLVMQRADRFGIERAWQVDGAARLSFKYLNGACTFGQGRVFQPLLQFFYQAQAASRQAQVGIIAEAVGQRKARVWQRAHSRNDAFVPQGAARQLASGDKKSPGQVAFT